MASYRVCNQIECQWIIFSSLLFSHQLQSRELGTRSSAVLQCAKVQNMTFSCAGLVRIMCTGLFSLPLVRSREAVWKIAFRKQHKKETMMSENQQKIGHVPKAQPFERTTKLYYHTERAAGHCASRLRKKETMMSANQQKRGHAVRKNSLS